METTVKHSDSTSDSTSGQIDLILSSGLFDRQYYAQQAGRSFKTSAEAVRHWITVGATKLLNPHCLFETRLYAEVRGAKREELDPLSHFLLEGWRAGLNPTPFFEHNYFAANVGRREWTEAPLSHYLTQPDAALLEPIPLFASRWYAATAGLKPGTHPLLHFLAGKAVLDPHPLFSTAFYCKQLGIELMPPQLALRHYLMDGWRFGISPHQLFDPAYYAAANPDLDRQATDCLSHFASVGAASGRKPNAYFDTTYYLASNLDVAKQGLNPLVHYVLYGEQEARKPNRLFDVSYYRGINSDLADYEGLLLAHFLHFGAAERRRVNPHFDARWYQAQYAAEIRGSCPYVHFAEIGALAGLQGSPAGTIVNTAQRHSEERNSRLRVEAERLPRQPSFSILVPVYRQSRVLLAKLVESVRRQAWPHWELCLLEDGSLSDDTWKAMVDLSLADKMRIKIISHGRNRGIAGATRNLIAMAEAEWVCFLDHDDELAEDALLELAKVINGDSTVDVLYSDEDKIDDEGWLCEPFHKPDWSPLFFLHCMYVGHFLAIRREIAVQAGGGPSSEFDGIQDYEFMLRVSEVTSRIRHVPRILYHWRRTLGSIAYDLDAKVGLDEKQVAAVTAHVRRIGYPRPVIRRHPTIRHRVITAISPGKPRPPPRFLSLQRPPIQEPLQARPRSKASELLALDSKQSDQSAQSGVTWELEMIFAHVLSRQILAETEASYIVLADTPAAPSSDVVQELVSWFDDARVGVVGGLIGDAHGRVLSCGLTFDNRVGASPCLRGVEMTSDGYFGNLSCPREVMLVDPRLMAIRTDIARKLGAIVKELGWYYGLMDLNLRIRDHGLVSIVTPYAVALRPNEEPVTARINRDLFLDRWSDRIAGVEFVQA
jgi:O-antigen biosynthesis protein